MLRSIRFTEKQLGREIFMMETINSVLRNTLLFYIIEIGILAALIFAGIQYVVHNKPNSEAMGVLTCILCLLVCMVLFRSTIPFAIDYFNHDICKIRGQYENKVGSNSTSGSSGLGFYAVSITNSAERIDLTTVPLAQNIFPEGVYQVEAYFTQRSKMLVYIEILEDGV